MGAAARYASKKGRSNYDGFFWIDGLLEGGGGKGNVIGFSLFYKRGRNESGTCSGQIGGKKKGTYLASVERCRGADSALLVLY